MKKLSFLFVAFAIVAFISLNACKQSAEKVEGEAEEVIEAVEEAVEEEVVEADSAAVEAEATEEEAPAEEAAE